MVDLHTWIVVARGAAAAEAVALLLRRLGRGADGPAATAAAPGVVYTSAFEARFHGGAYDAGIRGAQPNGIASNFTLSRFEKS